MKESNLIQEIRNDCKNIGAFFLKIPDSFNMSRFSPKKPFDIIVIYNGKTFCIEAKMVKTLSSFQINKIKQHQIDALKHASNNGAVSYVLINYRTKKNIIFAVEINDLIGIINYLSSINKKSIYLSWLEEHSIIIERIKINNKTRWDLAKIFLC